MQSITSQQAICKRRHGNQCSSKDNRPLWCSLVMDMDGNGSSICRSMVMGSLLVVHDESYKQKVAKDVCLGAEVIWCRWVGKTVSCAWTGRMNRKTATNISGEVLGEIVSQLIHLGHVKVGVAVTSWTWLVTAKSSGPPSPYKRTRHSRTYFGCSRSFSPPRRCRQ